MKEKVFIFDTRNAYTFYKAGQFIATEDWKHKDIINPGDYEFMMIIRGAIYINIEGKDFVVKKHECILIPPYIRHYGYRGADPGTTHYWMHFFPSGLVSFTEEIPYHLDQEEEEYHKLYIPQHFLIPDFEKIVILCNQLLDSANDSLCSPLTSNFIITSIAIEISNQYRKACRSIERKFPTKFEIILNWIRIHSHERLTVNIIAEAFEITPVYLTRLFKKYLNITTNHYIIQIKMQQADEMLLTSTKSIKEIALELNFSNEKYFMRMFKQHHGITPTHFRNTYPRTYLNNTVVDPTIPKPLVMMEDEND